MRLAVTGHRAFDDVTAVTAAVDVVLARVEPPDEVWSSLAEGADRLVVERVRARWPATALVVVLPLAAVDYATDFADVAAFERLLATADRVEVVPDGEGGRRGAYERAGHRVVDAADVLVALWDGQPARGRGGTAEVVAYALEHDVEVEVVLVTRP